MNTAMETYYYSLISHTGRMCTNQMIWWSRSIDRAEAMVNET